MLAAALRAEAAAFVARHAEETPPDGRRRVVRHGYGPERSVRTGIGALEMRRPKARDRAAAAPGGNRIGFGPAILPRWARRFAPSLDALPPGLRLRGISTGDLREALSAPPGTDAANLSPGVIRRPAGDRRREDGRWRRRDLSARRHVRIRADVYRPARMEAPAERMPVILGATPEGGKGASASGPACGRAPGAGGSVRSTSRPAGSPLPPEITTGDRAVGFPKALDEVFPGTRRRGCPGHETAEVPDWVPKSTPPAVNADPRDIRPAETRAAAEAAMDTFAERRGAKCEPAMSCPAEDREAAPAFHDFPADRQARLRPGDPIERVFATVRRRTVRTEGALPRKTAKPTVFKLARAAARTWRRPKDPNQSPQLVAGVTVSDGVAARDAEPRAA